MTNSHVDYKVVQPILDRQFFGTEEARIFTAGLTAAFALISNEGAEQEEVLAKLKATYDSFNDRFVNTYGQDVGEEFRRHINLA